MIDSTRGWGGYKHVCHSRAKSANSSTIIDLSPSANLAFQRAYVHNLTFTHCTRRGFVMALGGIISLLTLAIFVYYFQALPPSP